MGVKATLVRLPEDTGARIDALVGPHRRAVFIREAVENAVRIAEITATHRKKTESE